MASSQANQRSTFQLGLVDRVRVMVFPTIRGETGERPVFADLPDLDLNLTDTRVIDERLALSSAHGDW